MDVKNPASDFPPGATFARFGELPIEVQLYIWELILHDSAYVQIKWDAPEVTTLWPVTPIPQLKEGEEPGLIPHTLPPGLPATLRPFPRPLGVPDLQAAGIDWDSYDMPNYAKTMEAVYNQDSSPDGRSSFRKVYAHVANKIAASIIGKPQEGRNHETGLCRTPAACFWVCRASRIQALRHAIVDTGQPLQPNAIRTVGGIGSRFYPVKGGLILGSVFKEQRTKKHCVVFILGPNKAGYFRVCRNGHIAARLAAIEQCIFGHRLSLTELPEGIDKTRFGELDWAMWWWPELGYRARRPEANHPFHCPPQDIIWIYSMVLHHLVAAPVEAYPRLPECIAGKRSTYYSSGAWYFNLVKTGECLCCGRPLMQELGRWFPELLNPSGQIDILLLRDRKSIEEPEVVMHYRAHECMVQIGMMG